ELAAERAAAHPQGIPLVDALIADADRSKLLVLPVLMHQRTEISGAALLQHLLAAIAELFNVVQVGEHLGIALLGTNLLVLQDRTGNAREPCEEKQQVVFEIEKRIDADEQPLGIHRVVPTEGESGNASVGSDILVLLAYRLTQAIHLNIAREFRKFGRVNQPPAVHVQRL